MDKFLYIAMTGAKETMRAQAVNSHNLANASTTGFRADLAAFQARAVTGSGFDSRAYATNSTTGVDTTFGAMQATGRDLDVALQGQGFLAVQARDGLEAYTRAGDLRVDANGVLSTGAGHMVMGADGPLTIPPYTSLSIGGDGTVSIVPLGQTATTLSAIGRIKLVNPDANTLQRGEDGLFRRPNGEPAAADANIRVASGVLESSNVNIADAMVTMIQLQRHFDLQVKAMRSAEDNAASSAQLLRLG
jgi:flagellar basal-body rod protein FlgF